MPCVLSNQGGELIEKRVIRKKRVSVTHLRGFELPEGLGNVRSLKVEVDDMFDVLLGRVEPPIPSDRFDSLAEVANAYYARGQEINAKILEGEREGSIIRGSQHYKFRTGELRAFIEVAKLSYEMGSRRITIANMEV